ncbi:MAG: hypothetical protein ACRDJO_12500, partial [Actinomycetota bacterium]
MRRRQRLFIHHPRFEEGSVTMFIRRRDDEGSALILALVFLSLFGIFVAVLLTFVDSSFRTTTAVRDRGAVVYEADAAVEGAIQSIRPYVGQGVFGAVCDSFAFGTAINGVAVRVECEGLPGSGTSGDPGGVTPPAAVITTSTQDPSTVPPAQQVHGFQLEAQTEATIDGGILSASTIRLDNQSKLSVPAGKASARLTCSIGNAAQLLPGSASDCPTTLTGSDPGYPLPPGSAPSVTATLPGCGTGPVVTLPGDRKYTDQAALESLLRCGSRVFWFQPGIHYFEFATGDPDLYLQGNQASSSVYVAGTPLGWNPADPLVTPAALRALSAAGNSLCDNANTAPGAGFIFGKTSRLGMKDGVFEICAPNDQPAAKVAIYGVKTSTRGYSALTGCTTQIGDCTGDVKALIHTDVPGGVGNPMTFKVHGTVYA